MNILKLKKKKCINFFFNLIHFMFIFNQKHNIQYKLIFKLNKCITLGTAKYIPIYKNIKKYTQFYLLVHIQ